MNWLNILSIPHEVSHSLDCKEVSRMKLTINETGVFLDEQPIQNCTCVEIKNICPIDQMEVILHVIVNKADVHWEVMG